MLVFIEKNITNFTLVLNNLVHFYQSQKMRLKKAKRKTGAF